MKALRAFRTISLIAVLLLSGGQFAFSQDIDEEQIAKIDAVFAELDHWDHPGASLAVAKDGKVVYKRGYGCAQLEYNIPVTPSTVFHIASVSKQFTAFAIDVLAEQGKLSLDDDVRKYIPELHDFGEVITLRHLLNHTSGLRDQWELLVMAGWRMDDVITREHILKMLSHQRELNFKPGEQYLYCNSGYTLLAEIVTRVSGKSFPEWTMENIFRPLGMSNTHFHHDHQMIVPNRAYSYSQDEDGVFKKSVLSYANVGATSLFTTAEDLARWAINFDGGDLHGAVIKRMQTKGILNDGKEIPYAHGVMLSELAGVKVVSHGGADAGFRSMLMIFPEHRLSVVVLSNFADARTFQLAYNTALVFLPRREEPKEEETAATEESDDTEGEIDTSVYDDYLGKFRIEGSILVEFVRDGDQLFVIAAGQPQMEIFPRSKDTFFMKAADVDIAFQRNDEGKVHQAIVTQNGTESLAQKIDELVLSPEQLSEYAGEYYSDELGTSYTLVVRDGQLVATHRKHDDIPLTTEVSDVFAGEAWYFNSVKFVRNEQRLLTGFRLTGNRVLNLWFEKR